MPYTKQLTKFPIRQNIIPGLVTNQNKFDDTRKEEFYELEPAEVVDIILSSDHPSYKSIEDIGKIQVRFIYSQTDEYYNNIDTQLSWATPLNYNIKCYPLLHEIVLCGVYITFENYDILADPKEFNETIYYISTISVLNRLNNNSVPYISLSREYKEENQLESTKLGENFDSANLHNPIAAPQEGDVLFEGRTGNFIRLGSEDGEGVAPYFAVYNGELKSYSNYNIVIEDLNRKGTSSLIFGSSKELNLDIDLSTIKSFKPSKLNGVQAGLSSDRIIIFSKVSELLLFGKTNIGISAKENIELAGKNIILNGLQKVFLGEGADQAIVKGNELKDLLSSLLDILIQFKVICASPGSPSPSIDPGTLTKLTQLKVKLLKILSKKIYTI